MEFNIVQTTDGSKTLFSQYSKECYHSTNGAITESEHIFINLGLKSTNGTNVNILEVGYGTGLNAILTYLSNLQGKCNVFYHGIDVCPIDIKIGRELGYEQILNVDENIFTGFYTSWNDEIEISSNFRLLKQEVLLDKFISKRFYDIIYFDAFSPETQPEMWTVEVFEKLYRLMKIGGVLVTYSSKGVVKQNMRTVGFDVRRHPGPPGKRHVIHATKL
ncbi:MAG: tRNA (5-methylaminomethyl-2-thiouridine)(34)-methyltransferase MnmD [Bacteroidales bacterium]|nr:tRNA (5-methylaminomethyl-2-thiouridine)(34)-methyltransferase MnmD [Bacteroidales bacterium]